MKEKRFLNGLKPSYITQLAPLDIQMYADMVKKAQLLEDATDFIDRIKGRIFKEEQAPSSSSRASNVKKLPFNISEGPSQEWKPKIPTPSTQNKPNCKHCDKPGHTADECWRKVSMCLRCGSREHHIFHCPMLKENDKQLEGHKRQGRLQVVQETKTTEDGGVVEGTLQVFSQLAFVLFDIGATHSFISQNFADTVNIKPVSMGFKFPVTTPLGEKAKLNKYFP
ncbi:hypothetical protein Taro_036656 [Colocasia esculenta]|uniref:CCHC-type domain-containing protein n=1 Tax=Colocasia esculenta TaxID=4460 RepID=A0A843WGY3_COLES|nr:hypothetical protein [Colocasia esculenta]